MFFFIISSETKNILKHTIDENPKSSICHLCNLANGRSPVDEAGKVFYKFARLSKCLKSICLVLSKENLFSCGCVII